MVGEDRVIMSVKELRRVHVLRHAREKQLTQGPAGEAGNWSLKACVC